MVVTAHPCMAPSGLRHELTDRAVCPLPGPDSTTAHAPHPPSPHASFCTTQISARHDARDGDQKGWGRKRSRSL
jgi:hypothetical protein